MDRQQIIGKVTEAVEQAGCFLVDVTNINVCHNYVANMSTFPIDYYFLTPQTTFAQ